MCVGRITLYASISCYVFLQSIGMTLRGPALFGWSAWGCYSEVEVAKKAWKKGGHNGRLKKGHMYHNKQIEPRGLVT
jgi:hypothetical protein